MLRLRTLIRQSATGIFDVLDEIERLSGGHRHGIDAIRLQMITVARWATLARRLRSRQSPLTHELRSLKLRLWSELSRRRKDATALEYGRRTSRQTGLSSNSSCDQGSREHGL